MQESVIYQDILQKGEIKGEQKKAFRFLNRQLNRRFGEISLPLTLPGLKTRGFYIHRQNLL